MKSYGEKSKGKKNGGLYTFLSTEHVFSVFFYLQILTRTKPWNININ